MKISIKRYALMGYYIVPFRSCILVVSGGQSYSMYSVLSNYFIINRASCSVILTCNTHASDLSQGAAAGEDQGDSPVRRVGEPHECAQMEETRR